MTRHFLDLSDFSGNELRAIEFPRIKGGKAFDTTQPWFKDLLKEIGQPMTATVQVAH